MKKHEIGPCRGAPYLRCMTRGLAGCHECSPPAENSEAPGASGADDGQGACALPPYYMVGFAHEAGVEATERVSSLPQVLAVVLFCFARGARCVVVERVPA